MNYSDRHISDEELDQLFRDAHASEGQEALFVPEFWSEMEAMLPAETKRKRGLYWIPVSAIAVLSLLMLFYPESTTRIDRLEQKITAGSKEKNPPVDGSAMITQNSSGKGAGETEIRTNEPNLKTALEINAQPLRVWDTDGKESKGMDDRGSFARMDESDHVEIKEINPAQPESITDSGSELEPINLGTRYERITHEEISPLPESTSDEFNEWYMELGPTIGQSPYLSPDQKRNVVGGAVLGGGYTKRIDHAFVSFGLQARMEGFGGLDYRETNFSAGITRNVSVEQLYSIEVPLRFGYAFKRSEFALGVVPGIQLFIHGEETITENQVVTSRNSFTGKVEHSNSMTMEIGFQYYYNLTPKWSLGAKLNADILRPFHTDYYLGKSAGLPVNGQLVLRTRFLK